MILPGVRRNGHLPMFEKNRHWRKIRKKDREMMGKLKNDVIFQNPNANPSESPGDEPGAHSTH